MDLMSVNTHEDWTELYKKLVHWELELENINDSSMLEILESQISEANNLFYKFIFKCCRLLNLISGLIYS